MQIYMIALKVFWKRISCHICDSPTVLVKEISYPNVETAIKLDNGEPNYCQHKCASRDTYAAASVSSELTLRNQPVEVVTHAARAQSRPLNVSSTGSSVGILLNFLLKLVILMPSWWSIKWEIESVVCVTRECNQCLVFFNYSWQPITFKPVEQ